MTAQSMTATYRLWRRCRRLPAFLGTRVFSLAVWFKAPYFRTVTPRVVELAPGRCVVTGRRWWGVTNHIGTYHAIAACNLG